jgi:hypothetical protein
MHLKPEPEEVEARLRGVHDMGLGLIQA